MSRGIDRGWRNRRASCFVMTSLTVTVSITGQNSAALLLLRIFLALLAVDAVAGMRQRVETLERDLLAAVVALAEGLRRSIEAAPRSVDCPEESTLLAGEQERLLALHRIG